MDESEVARFHMCRRTFLGLAGVAVVLIPVSGCGSGNSASPGGTTSPPVQAVSSDGRASVILPFGAYPSGTTATISVGSVPPSLSDADSPGPVYAFGITNGTGRHLSRNPSRATQVGDITLVLPYDSSMIDADTGAVYVASPGQTTLTFVEATFDLASSTVTAFLPLNVLDYFDSLSKSRAETSDITFGTVRLRPPSSPGAVDPKLYWYERSAVPNVTGRWNDGWDGVFPVDGKRIAVIVPGTFTRRGDPLKGEGGRPGNSRFQQLGDFLINMDETGDALVTPFFSGVVGFEYDDIRATPDASGQVLAGYLKQLLAQGAQLYLFAHSQGGLVARWAVEKGGCGDVSALVMFGTPNQGIPTVGVETVAAHQDQKLCPEADKVKLLGVYVSCSDRLYRDSPALKAMDTGWYSTRNLSKQSAFLHSLNDSPPSPKPLCVYFTVAGTLGFSTFIRSDDSDGWSTWGYAANYGANDGTVVTYSAEGTDIDLSRYCSRVGDRIRIEVSHSNLPLIGNNPPVLGETLKRWLRSEAHDDYGSAGFTIR